MEREMKNCPFCGGRMIFNEEFEREFAEERFKESKTFTLEATCNQCGVRVIVGEHEVPDPENIDQAVRLLYEKVNRREGEKALRLELDMVRLDNSFLEDRIGDEKARADALEKENSRLRSAIVESFINRTVTA